MNELVMSVWSSSQVITHGNAVQSQQQLLAQAAERDPFRDRGCATIAQISAQRGGLGGMGGSLRENYTLWEAHGAREISNGATRLRSITRVAIPSTIFTNSTNEYYGRSSSQVDTRRRAASVPALAPQTCSLERLCRQQQRVPGATARAACNTDAGATGRAASRVCQQHPLAPTPRRRARSRRASRRAPGVLLNAPPCGSNAGTV